MLAFLPALVALLPFASGARASDAADAPITIHVTLQAGPLAAARIWRFEGVDASGAVADTVELSLSGDGSDVSANFRALPSGAYTVRQVFGNDMALACGPRVFYANAAPEQVVQLAGAGAVANFTISVCPGAPGGVVVDRPIDNVTVTPTTIVDEVRGTRTAGTGTPLAPSTGSGQATAAWSAEPDTHLIAAIGVLLFVAPLAFTAIRRS